MHVGYLSCSNCQCPDSMSVEHSSAATTVGASPTAEVVSQRQVIICPTCGNTRLIETTTAAAAVTNPSTAGTAADAAHPVVPSLLVTAPLGTTVEPSSVSAFTTATTATTAVPASYHHHQRLAPQFTVASAARSASASAPSLPRPPVLTRHLKSTSTLNELSQHTSSVLATASSPSSSPSATSGITGATSPSSSLSPLLFPLHGSRSLHLYQQQHLQQPQQHHHHQSHQHPLQQQQRTLPTSTAATSGAAASSSPTVFPKASHEPQPHSHPLRQQHYHRHHHRHHPSSSSSGTSAVPASSTSASSTEARLRRRSLRPLSSNAATASSSSPPSSVTTAHSSATPIPPASSSRSPPVPQSLEEALRGTISSKFSHYGTTRSKSASATATCPSSSSSSLPSFSMDHPPTDTPTATTTTPTTSSTSSSNSSTGTTARASSSSFPGIHMRTGRLMFVKKPIAPMNKLEKRAEELYRKLLRHRPQLIRGKSKEFCLRVLRTYILYHGIPRGSRAAMDFQSLQLYAEDLAKQINLARQSRGGGSASTSDRTSISSPLSGSAVSAPASTLSDIDGSPRRSSSMPIPVAPASRPLNLTRSHSVGPSEELAMAMDVERAIANPPATFEHMTPTPSRVPSSSSTISTSTSASTVSLSASPSLASLASPPAFQHSSLAIAALQARLGIRRTNAAFLTSESNAPPAAAVATAVAVMRDCSPAQMAAAAAAAAAVAEVSTPGRHSSSPTMLSSSSPSDLLLDSPAVSPSTGRRIGQHCHMCSKKLGFKGIECRCGNIFCAKHRCSISHACTYDYKADSRRLLQLELPLVAAPKVPEF